MTRLSGNSDPEVQQILDVLRSYDAAHPQARIEAHRQNSASIRVRIIDPAFRGVDRIDREEKVWKILEALPETAQSRITLLLLLTPEETQFSFTNFEFDNPVASRL